MSFDLVDLTELEKRFEHIPSSVTTDYEAHKKVVGQLLETAKNLLNMIPYGQEAETFVTKLVSAGEEIHNAIDKPAPGQSVQMGQVVKESPDEAGVAPEQPLAQPAPVAPASF